MVAVLEKGLEESDEKYIERIIQNECTGMTNVSAKALKSLRAKLLKTFHPDKYLDDTRYVDIILDKLSSDKLYRYISVTPIVPTVQKVTFGDLRNELIQSIYDAFAASEESAPPSRAHLSQRNFCCDTTAAHSGESSVVDVPRKRMKTSTPIDSDLREPFVHSFVKLLIEKVFLPRGMLPGNAKLYAKHIRLILMDQHALCAYLPRLTDQYVTNLFVTWADGFDAWSNNIRPYDKRGNPGDKKGNGHAALHAMYDFTEARMQALFEDAMRMVM